MTPVLFCMNSRIGGSIPVVFAYFAEFCIVKNRGQKLGFLLLFWVIGGVYVSALGWLVIPQKREYDYDMHNNVKM